jgi:hypothetical protein
MAAEMVTNWETDVPLLVVLDIMVWPILTAEELLTSPGASSVTALATSALDQPQPTVYLAHRIIIFTTSIPLIRRQIPSQRLLAHAKSRRLMEHSLSNFLLIRSLPGLQLTSKILMEPIIMPSTSFRMPSRKLMKCQHLSRAPI